LKDACGRKRKNRGKGVREAGSRGCRIALNRTLNRAREVERRYLKKTGLR